MHPRVKLPLVSLSLLIAMARKCHSVVCVANTKKILPIQVGSEKS